MFDNLVARGTLLALPAVALIMLAGCKENEISAPAPEPVDLSQTEDLYTAPVKPNPLTNDPEAVVVRVNGEDIKRGEIMDMMKVAMKQYAGRVAPDQLQQLQGQLYEQIKSDLITKKLIDAAVVAAGIKVDDAKVEETLEGIKGSIPEGQTIEGILESRGQDLASFKENLVKELASQELFESKTADIANATDAEIKEFFDSNPDQFVTPESVTASHILIKVDADDSDEVKAEKKAKLEKIRSSIIDGTTTFEAAAKDNSDCPSSAQGGSLGTFKKGQMVPEFEVAAFSQEIGEVGPLIETQFGYHIVKVTDHKEESAMDYDSVKDQIGPYLTKQKKQKAFSDYIKSLHDSATIEEIAM